MDCKGFFDLNVLSNGSDIENISKEWYKYKYRTIAVNQIVDLTEGMSTKKKKGEKSDSLIPEPYEIKLPRELSGKLSVLNRLTVKIGDLSHFPKIFQGRSLPIKKYHIIAVIVDDQACLQQAIATSEVDIISVDCITKPQWKLTKKNYNAILEQNKYFELCYSPMLRDSSNFSNTVFMSHVLYTIGKSKNIILSSGTADKSFLRTPYEVMYLSYVFGFNENKARNCLTTDPSSLVNRAIKRQMGKSCFTVVAV